MIKNISNLGDAALYCDFGTEVNKQINSEVIKYFNNIREKNISGINNLTPSYNKLIISFDLKVTNFKEIKKIIELDKSRRETQSKLDSYLAESNKLAKKIGDIFKKGGNEKANSYKEKASLLKLESKKISDVLNAD